MDFESLMKMLLMKETGGLPSLLAPADTDTGLTKFLKGLGTTLGSTRFQYSSPGGRFNLSGGDPGLPGKIMLSQFLKGMGKGDRNPAKTTDAGASLLLNRASSVSLAPVDIDPLNRLSLSPRWEDFTDWGR